jgi:glycosyltransferase involved in cell wall biosynthesis
LKLSIILPAYNEAQRIEPALAAYAEYFVPRYPDDVELLVVVNGSTDRTEEVARGIAVRYPQIRVLVEPRPIGKGGAVMLGFEEAAGSLVGFTDADGSTPPAAYDELVRACATADCVIGSRWAPGSDVEPKQPISRRIASRIFNFMVNQLFLLHLTDTQCGAKVMSRTAMQSVLPKLGLTRWAFDVDLLFQLRRAHCRIVEIPTIWHDVRGSKVNVPVASVQMTLAITRLRLLYSPFAFIVHSYDRLTGTVRWIWGIR